MPFPNWSIGPSAPLGAIQGDVWYDTTNGHLNMYTTASAGFVQISAPAITGNINASQANNGGPLYIPAITATMGGSWNVPPGYVGVAYDIVHNRMCVVGSGGVTFKTAAFA